ncbi:hypothetical protein SELMODRAFT_72023, partial [Selaginella moellendorffii]
NTMITVYAQIGHLQEARVMFKAMPEPDTVSWNALLAAYAQNGHLLEARVFFRMMPEKDGFKPDAVTTIAMLSACIHKGLVERGRGLFLAMEGDHGVAPKQAHFRCMVSVLGRAGQLGRAEELSKTMPFVADSIVWTALLDSCRAQGDERRAMPVAESLARSEPGDAAPYLLLSSI